MIVSCSSCSTRYLVDPAQIGVTGRMVRCAKCGHTWMEEAPADMPWPVEPPPPSFVSGNLPVLAQARRRQMPVLTWIGLSFAVLLAVAVVLQARDAIVEQWPYAERLYRAAGFPAEASRVEQPGPDSADASGG